MQAKPAALRVMARDRLTTYLKISGKRVVFSGIQASATTHTEHYAPMPTRTGYERVLAHRMEDLYAKTARHDGTVTALTDKALTVTYSDKSVEVFEIGRRFGKWSGKIIPHEIATTLKLNDKFKSGDLLIYNNRFFHIDKLVPGTPVFKNSTLARVALWESTDTLEDSSALSPEFAAKMVTMSTHIRSINLKFDQEIRNLLKVGDFVEEDSILCTLHAATAGATTIFNEQALDTLSRIGRLTPKAKYAGTIERIEVLYCGDLENMSRSLQTVASKSDQDMYKLNKQLGRRVHTGEVALGYRVDGTPLAEDMAVVRVYITGPTAFGGGDKLVFGNQLKSVTGRIFTGVQETEDGKAIDAVFGYQSIANRIVNSAEIMGTTNSLMVTLGELALKAYDS